MKREHQVRWSGGLGFVGTSPDGHSLVIDGDRETGMSPMDMLLLSAGACAAIDLVTILKKSRQRVMDATVEMGGVRRDEHPRYYTSVEMHFLVYGVDVQAARVERAIELAMEKYCSASAQLMALADVRTSYEIIDSAVPT
jgi:putative redox protein